MNKFIKTIATAMVVFALLISAVLAPAVEIAHAQIPSGQGLSFEIPDFDFGSIGSGIGGNGQSSSESSSSSGGLQRCEIESSSRIVATGESVTLSWEVSGFDTITINGETVQGSIGSLVIPNLQDDTTFVLRASGSNGSCMAQAFVECLPPPPDPKECKLEVIKSVNKATAIVGDTLTYTIGIENTGDANCTGGGVRIEDVLDSKLTYVSQTSLANITPGYGSKGVYTASDRTLRFNGDTLTPGERGTMTVIARVNTPTTCGDFEIPNQAKATAKELNNFTQWAYSNTVKTTIDNDCAVPVPECTLDAAPMAVLSGNTSVLTWTTKNAETASLTSFGTVELNGSRSTGVLTETKSYTLTVTGYGEEVQCHKTVTVSENPAPSCDEFTATPATIVEGQSATLNWNTSNASRVVINNGIGEVAVDGSISVTPLSSITYSLTVFGTNDRSVNCQVPVTVSEDPVPVCEAFTVSPTSVPFGGANVTLNWSVKNASTIVINPTIGTVAASGTRSQFVDTNTTYTLTATDSNGDQESGPATAMVQPQPEVFTCEDNVTFRTSDSLIDEGDSATLTWSTVGADSVNISGINVTTLSGSQTVSPSSNTTYTLTAVKGTKTVNCPVSITVNEDNGGGGGGNGGGGGSSTPRCELTISDKSIKRGEEITLRWDTTRATEVVIEDDRGNVLITTERLLADDKKEFFDGSIKIKPTRDTIYTLEASRGSRDRECAVKVEVEDSVVVLETRDQQPLVAGISLSQVPYTGFEAGPFLTIMFYALLVAWALYLTYMLVVRNQVTVSDSVDSFDPITNVQVMKRAESVRPDVFVESVIPPVVESTLPMNLPTGAPIIGYANLATGGEDEMVVNPHHPTDDMVTALENRAHEQKALLSSDAIQHFISTTEGVLERNEALDTVISEAKTMYPLEDGWMVINEARMRTLCDICNVNQVASLEAPFVPAVLPTGSSSLAEAIVTGNIVAAYEMIGNRPMFALADAAADLDAIYRNRRGGEAIVSELLNRETARLSDETIKNMITALTGALDGTYTDEASAVKMAIMKAVKEAA